MKCNILYSQYIYWLIITFVCFSFIVKCKDVKPPKANPFKEDKTVNHSLFREKDALERMSAYTRGVPPVKTDSNNKNNNKIPEPEQVIAMRIVEQYKKIFDFLDYKPVDDLLTSEELSEAFRDFNWPKSNHEITDDLDYAKVIIRQYDTNNKNSINFLEFCKFMEDMWNSADLMQEEKCKIGFNKAKEIFVKLFEWLDRDHDDSITPEDMIYGISRIMIRDVDMKEVQDVFAKYDPKKTGKLTLDSFLLSIANGLLDNTFKDEFLTDTFIK